MSTFLKPLVGLGIVLPLAAFVFGSLMTASDDPTPRERIVIRDDSQEPRERPDQGRKPDVGDDDDGDDDGPDPTRGTGKADDNGDESRDDDDD